MTFNTLALLETGHSASGLVYSLVSDSVQCLAFAAFSALRFF
jgi:hypothetical protein